MNTDSTKKYDNGCCILYKILIDGLKDIWNFYFDNQNAVPMITGTVLGYLESGNQNSSNDELKVQLNREQRKEIIDKTESEIDAGKMKHLERMASRFAINAYNRYNTLSEFLEESGVVYKVEMSGVYILINKKRGFEKLVGYEYCELTRSYCLYLI